MCKVERISSILMASFGKIEIPSKRCLCNVVESGDYDFFVFWPEKKGCFLKENKPKGGGKVVIPIRHT